jgi:glycosyltransferase involved in cell wall biosynthesis
LVVSVVIPAYNEEKTIGEVIVRVKRVCDAEIIVVDDASTDKTFEVAKKNGASIVRNLARMGPSAAVCRGIKEASGHLIITIDGDLDHFPEEIPKLLALAGKGTDIVIGERQYLPRLSERVLSFLTSKTIAIKDPLSGLRAYNPEIFSSLDFGKPETYGMIFLAKALSHGYKIAGVSVNSRTKRSKSRIGYSFHVDLRILISGIFFLYFFFLGFWRIQKSTS